MGQVTVGVPEMSGGVAAMSPSDQMSTVTMGSIPGASFAPGVAAPIDGDHLAAADVRPPRKIPRWLLALIGYGTSAVVGLGLGYLLIRWLFPNSHLPSLW
jgi:hypothetical protein